ncbi:MAG: ATP-binding cassette domain-containing protein [Arachnia sp.]
MITLKGVLKTYSSEVAIGPVDLEIPEGGITALVGANGAGKSTLLTMIGRLLGMDAGAIEIAGYDVASTKSKDLARIVSILRQENHFITRLTVRQLVGFGRFPHSQGRLTALDEEKISQAIDFLDLGALETRYLDHLSGGQRQRAYVAMVLAQDTEYVLLDEPLNNLDVAHSHSMLQTLRRAADELGKTVVIVVHDINYASCWADQIVAMKDGRLVAMGSPEEIVRRELLQEVFDLEIDVTEYRGRRIAHFYLPVTAAT